MTTTWRPMDEAPRDGKTVWLREDGRAYHGFWMWCGWWIPWEGDLWPSKPEAWRPVELPGGAERRAEGTSRAERDVDCAEGKS